MPRDARVSKGETRGGLESPGAAPDKAISPSFPASPRAPLTGLGTWDPGSWLRQPAKMGTFTGLGGEGGGLPGGAAREE